MAKKMISMKLVYGFIRFHRNSSVKHRQSPYDVAAEILIENGVENTDDLKSKDFIRLHIEKISAEQKGKSGAPKKRDEAVKTTTLSKKKVKEVKDNSFLLGYAWRSLRMKAIKIYGRECMCCGASKENGAVINVDHIKPRAKNPELALDLSNLQILCHECNHGKGNWDETDWRTDEHKKQLYVYLDKQPHQRG